MLDAFSGVLDLDRDAPEPLHVQITLQIKTAVLTGGLGARTQLPSSRLLAAELGVSRNTVLAALDQLKAEGIVEAMRGSGTRVDGQPLSEFHLAPDEAVHRGVLMGFAAWD